ncbi:hypothetical protein TTHERM_00633370 (macronuclear) [Tetrahymena thermophila SB210]|uniref:EF-hand domain-containing protein n=1 Tax=Tetrahymena thermophila (strain SB210) TaxID=312017 RepID=Q22X16_TETTS|nr:hypothetical protein TTHERM_00633370 [Tetrahymena thermophila SB210]EAR89830.3 hypothetical protein TTHERM_00633370 [Tetrahymena thermophila SB210]|eukprot:XP_001010075.3 hypothetical protein TTHERM_00633370 [Tetrahymena thermophila SB210]
MVDTFSNNQSSMGLSKKFGTTTNYNLLSNIPRAVILQIKNDGNLFRQRAVKFSQELWKTMRKSDFTSNRQLGIKLIEQIYEKHKEDIIEQFQINSPNEFLNIFDSDNDGFLNEDEQILVFSTLKEKMQHTANSLLKIQEYSEFKLLMKELREIEILIAEYQDQLRQQIYNNELNLYQQIGEERLDDFYDSYYDEFGKLEEYKAQRRAELQLKQVEERNMLEDKLGKAVELVKIKPKKKLKEYQIQEKLVSLDERVEEALDFRKELKDLEAKEQERVEKLQIERAEKQRSNLQEKHKKERQQLEGKLQEAQFKLIIKMKKDFNTLSKKNHLHEHEIKRIQGLTSKGAMKDGLNQGELMRTKNKSRQQNNIIMESKKITSNFNSLQSSEDQNPLFRGRVTHGGGATTGAGTINPFQGVARSTVRGHSTSGGSQNQVGTMNTNVSLLNTNVVSPKHQFSSNQQYLQHIIKHGDIVNFYIKKKWGADLPVNHKQEPHNNGKAIPNHEKIERILMAKKKSKLDILPSLTDLYDEELNLRAFNETNRSEEEIKKEKLKKRQYINEMLSL